ncbi:MAG: hypothetical protein NC453_26655 [Muribaculum sp.]|nr:hypothetical protein [Muribaculum sp.]
MNTVNQTADIKNVSLSNPIEFFRVKSQEAHSLKTKENLQYAINALSVFIGDSQFDYNSFTESMVGEWISQLLFQGYSPKTISNNILKRIATLYNKAVEDGLAQPTEVFRKVQNLLNDYLSSLLVEFGDSNTFGKVQDLIRKDYSSNLRMQLAKDMLLFAIYNGGMSFEEIANYKKDEYKGDNKFIFEIVNKYSKPKNKYLFPLNRVNASAKKLSRSVQVLIGDMLRNHGLLLSSNPDDTTFSLWAYLAMSCGVSASDTSACIAPRNKNVPITRFAVPSELTETHIKEIREKIETTLNHNPLHWYAMHLRPRVEYKNLTDRLSEKEISLDEIYYPMEDVIRRVGKKKIFESQPVISWLVFFRSRVTALNKLYKEIGDLAWGYRYLPDFKSPYAVISDSEIRYYQESIGTLSPGTSILRDDEVVFNEGDYLVVLGGPLNGRHAIFVSEKKSKDNSAGEKIVYRVKLACGTNANWIVDRDPNLVRKITESQYIEMDRLFRESLDDSTNE